MRARGKYRSYTFGTTILTSVTSRVIDYDNGGHAIKWNYPMDHPGVGGTVNFAGGGSRTYSVSNSPRLAVLTSDYVDRGRLRRSQPP